MVGGDTSTGDTQTGGTMPARRSVLIVGTEDRDYQSLRQLLSRWNCEVHSARTCMEGLRELRENSFAIVICDGVLPDGHWTKLLEETAAHPDGPLLIVASSLTTGPLLDLVRGEGGHDLLFKPFDAEEVHLVITGGFRQWAHQAIGQRRREH